jgi:hypothetical protein
MAIRKAILLIALVLAVTALSPTALALAGDTDRPVSGSVSGTATGTIGLTFAAEGTGTLTHLGRVTTTIEGTIDNTNQIGRVALNGTITFVSANGDQLTGTFSGTADQNREVTLLVTITGGTGRFLGASGTLTVTGSNTTTIFADLSFVASFEFPFTGEISY